MVTVEHAPKFITKEFSPIHQITDLQMIKTLRCDGFNEFFKPRSMKFTDHYAEQYRPHTGGKAFVRSGFIQGTDDKLYSINLIRDLDNIGVIVRGDNNQDVLKVNFRDRRKDGELGATPPKLLREIGGYDKTQIPPRSKEIGATSWYYSSPGDKQIPGRKSVEFSIVSSNPTKSLAKALESKQAHLREDAKELTTFIDDPFAFIPFSKPTEEGVKHWWYLWKQVVQRGLRGKRIPYPGQTAQSGFTGFFDHVVDQSKKLLTPLGFTHLSRVPTWNYVWNLNMDRGFKPDDLEQHEEALAFFKKLTNVKLPEDKILGDLNYKNPLFSWIAITPFIMQLNPAYTPVFNAPVAGFVEGNLQNLFESMKAQFVNPENNEVSTYPLAPGRNLWHSLDLTS
jgi:hypothetical protein